jgi:hypothetical protein
MAPNFIMANEHSAGTPLITPEFFSGQIVSMYPSGCFVKLAQGKDAFFERFSVVHERVLKNLHPGVWVKGEAADSNAEIIRLEGVDIL